VERYRSRNNSSAKAIAVASISDLERATGAADFHVPSFKKAAIGFFGSITFLYTAAFFLSAVI
jgi:hypothetical protein